MFVELMVNIVIERKHKYIWCRRSQSLKYHLRMAICLAWMFDKQSQQLWEI